MANLDGTKIAAAVLGGLVVALLSSLVTASVIGSNHTSRTEVQKTVDRSIEPVHTDINRIYVQLAAIDVKIDEVVAAVAAGD